MRVLVTGSSGFVGNYVCSHLLESGFSVLASSRDKLYLPDGVEFVYFPILTSKLHASRFLSDVDCIIHLAGRAHVMLETSNNPLEEFVKTNVDLTLLLARSAVRAGVKHFIYVSSIKVNGDSTSVDRPFTLYDSPNPIDYYALSKYKAEMGLKQISLSSDLCVTVIRPPLIYGPSVKGNLSSLVSLLSTNIPIPLGAIDFNLRSYISLYNFADFLVLATQSTPISSFSTYLVSDQEDISTLTLIESLSSALRVSPNIFSLPPSILRCILMISGRSSSYWRLCGSLRVDSSYASSTLGWNPPFSLQEGLNMSFSSLHK